MRSNLFALFYIVASVLYGVYVVGMGVRAMLVLFTASVLYGVWVSRASYMDSKRFSMPISGGYGINVPPGCQLRFAIGGCTHSMSGFGFAPNLIVLNNEAYLLSGPAVKGVIDHEIAHIQLHHTVWVLVSRVASMQACFFLITMYPLYLICKYFGLRIAEDVMRWCVFGASILIAVVSGLLGFHKAALFTSWYILNVYLDAIMVYAEELEADEYAVRLDKDNRLRLQLFLSGAEYFDVPLRVLGVRLGFPVHSHPRNMTRINRLRAMEKPLKL